MQKYKICPSCQTKNDPKLLECTACEADLTRVRITDEESERLQETVTPSPAESAPMIRLCDCGEKNPPNARKCRACGEEISDVTPTPDTSVEMETSDAAPEYVLTSLDGAYALRLDVPETVVGRAEAMREYLAAKPYVSRVHARFTLRDGALWIENLSGTNFTYVNNVRITGKTALKDGDEVGLGGLALDGARQSGAAYLLVRISPCT